MRKNTRVKYSVVVDTNVIYSAIFYPNGNENALFKRADAGEIKIIIFDYVYEELTGVLQRMNIDPILIPDFLDTYDNIEFIEEDISVYDELIKIAKEAVSHRNDRPIFIFAKKKMQMDEKMYLVSGNKHLLTRRVKKELFGRVKKPSQMLKLLRKTP